jgi:pyruvate,water dikinase
MPGAGNGHIRWFEDFSAGDIATVGGKNASLGEMIATLQDAGIRVPRGFAITTDAYWRLVRHNEIDAEIRAHLE